MNDNQSKRIWKKSWTGRRCFRPWLILVAATFLILLIVTQVLPHGPQTFSDWLTALLFFLVASVVVATICLGLWQFARWLFCGRNLKRTLFASACLVTLVALFYAEEDWRGKHDWDQFKRQWEAKGERFDYASVIPPAVPDDQNFAMAPIWVELIETDSGTNNAVKLYGKKLVELDRAGLTNSLHMNVCDWDNSDRPPAIGNWEEGTLTDLKRWQNYYRTLAARTNVFPVPPQPQSPAADVLLALSKYNWAIEKLRQASRRPDSRFPLNYDTEPPAMILLPHLAVLKRSSQVLQLRAIAELQDGQSDQALADVKLMLYLANSIRTEPFLISHLVRIAIANITLQPIYEGLAEHKWSEAQLVELEQELGQLNVLSGYKVGMRGEMVLCQIGDIEFLRRFPGQFQALTSEGASSPPLLARIIAQLPPSGWFYQNELHCARMMLEYYLPTVDPVRQLVSPAAVRKAAAATTADLRHPNPFNLLERMLVPALGPASRKFAWDQEAVDLARVACALERYRLAHGEFPESLDMLAPQFIPQLPHDIINGQPLHYHLGADGQFVLYSVGWNETDDGGTVAFHKGSSGRLDINKGDWVWRYPAK